jgi:hypothetical protein
VLAQAGTPGSGRIKPRLGSAKEAGFVGSVRADLRLLARGGLVQEQSDPLGEPRYARDDVVCLKQANEARKREAVRSTLADAPAELVQDSATP